MDSLQRRRERDGARRAAETAQQGEERPSKWRVADKKHREAETPEKRELRLGKRRDGLDWRLSEYLNRKELLLKLIRKDWLDWRC